MSEESRGKSGRGREREREREQKSRLGAFVRPSSQGCLNAYKRNGPRPPTHIIKSALDASCWGKRHDPATPMAAVRRQVSACILYTSAGNGQAGARHTEARRGEASSAWCDLVGRHVASACIWMGGMDEWMNGWMYQITHTYLGTDIIYTVSSAVSLWALQAVIRHTHTRFLSLSLSRQAVGQSDRRRLITSTHGTLWIGGKPSWSADITQDQRRAPQLREGDPPRSRGRWGGCHWPHRSRMASPGRRGSDAGVAGVATGGRGGVCSVCMYVRSLDTGLPGCMFRTTSKRASSVRLCLFACQGLETTLPYSLARALSLSSTSA